ATIVKAALKLWLRNESVVADAGASVTDILANKISDDLTLRRARRFFEDLELPIAKQLRNLRESEFRNLPENEWTASVLAAGDSFNNANLTTKDLLSRGLNPLFLERYIRACDEEATRDLSQD